MPTAIIRDRIRQLVSRRIGMQIRAEDSDKLGQALQTRMHALGLDDEAEYLALLSARDAGSEREWPQLTAGLTNLESYFFRDQQQMSLLRHWVLPDLLKRHASDRSLNIWSAGCSTGEEPYTIAMLLDELLPDVESWDISIHGTDITEHAVRKAMRAQYGEWSFRRVSREVRDRYFHAQPDSHGREWRLDERIRRMVDFRVGNLLDDATYAHLVYPAPLDLIVCRNVFIYFEHEAISKVMKRFYNTLATDGYLLTGHGELLAQDTGRFLSRIFPESVIYQRPAKQPEAPLPKPAPDRQTDEASPVSVIASALEAVAAPAAPEAPRISPLYVEAEQRLAESDYAGAVRLADRLLELGAQRYEGHYVMAQAQANLGRYEQAIGHCLQASDANPRAIEPYYLQAYVLEQLGQLEDAMKAYQAVVERAPAFVPAKLELAALYEAEGRDEQANRLRQLALRLLRQRPGSSAIKPYKGITVRDMTGYLEEKLGTQHAGRGRVTGSPAWNTGATPGRLSRALPGLPRRRRPKSVVLPVVGPDDTLREVGGQPGSAQQVSPSQDLDALLSAATAALQSHVYTEVIENARKVLEHDQESYQALMLLAKAHANLGHHADAERCCTRAMQAAPLEKEPHYLLAQVLIEQQDRAGALAELKKVIYLAPGFVAGYLHAAMLYQDMGEVARARQMYRSGLDLLENMPTDAAVETYENHTAGQLIEQLQAVLSGTGLST